MQRQLCQTFQKLSNSWSAQMDLRTKEALRYLGYRKQEIDDRILQLIKEAFVELEKIAKKRCVYQVFESTISNDNQLQIGPLRIESKSLVQNLKGCSRVAIFAATLGTEVDRLIRQYEIIDLPRAVVLGACAASYLEEYCDAVQKNIGEEFGKQVKLRPRFSAGYGDCSIEYQDQILRMLDAQKKIGLTLTEAKMMTPSKSVTAFVGVCDTKENRDVTR